MALIYVVEDDEPIRRELVDILARAGFEVEACESFEHVSRDILAAAPDLVLLDLTLPVKDGQHICHEVRHESEVPIIVLTSRTTEIDEVMAMTLGADDFVPKPYSARARGAHQCLAASHRGGGRAQHARPQGAGARSRPFYGHQHGDRRQHRAHQK